MRGTPHTPAQFWAHKTVNEAGCWLWTGARKANGYGSTTTGHGMMEYAHRYAWHLTHGPIPTGLYVCHACDVRACFNPDHLFLGTATANMRDALEKQRLSRGVRHSLTVRGEHNAHAVLTPDAVIDIRAGVQAGLSYAVVGAPWGVGKAGVAHVVRGRSWAHIASEASL